MKEIIAGPVTVALCLLSILHSPVVQCLLLQSSSDLISVLCSTQIYDTVLVLNSTIDYNITQDISCVVNVTNDVNSLKIIGLPLSKTAEIWCSSNTNQFQNSFTFVNLTVTLVNVEFIHCGTYLSLLPSNILSAINSSQLVFKTNHSALLLFINCNVSMADTTIKQYHGFAIIAINPVNASFTNVNITDTSHTDAAKLGAGILSLFDNSITQQSTDNNPFFTISNCSLYANNNGGTDSISFDLKGSIDSHFRGINLAQVAIVNAPAITVILHQTIVTPAITIDHSNFTHNLGLGYSAGLMIVVLHNKGPLGKVTVSNTVFKRNYNIFPCPGTALVFYILNGIKQQSYTSSNATSDVTTVLNIENTTFDHHIGSGLFGDQSYQPFVSSVMHILVKGSSLHSRNKMEFNFQNVTCKNNSSPDHSTCLLAEVAAPNQYNRKFQTVYMTFASVKAFDSNYFFPTFLVVPIFLFKNIDKIVITGTATNPSMFWNNVGSVIETHNSNVHLQGNVIFYNNIAMYGAALYLKNSYLYFSSHGLRNVSFFNNTVSKQGGAIRIWNDNIGTEIQECALHFREAGGAIKVMFINNTARLGGNSISAFPIYSCYDSVNNRKIGNSLDYYLNNMMPFNLSSLNNNNEITSKPDTVYLCHKSSDSQNSNINIPAYLGELIEININVFDQSGQSVYSEMKTKFLTYRHHYDLQFTVSSLFSQQSRIIKESNKNECTPIYVYSIKPADKVDKEVLVFSVNDNDHKVQPRLNIKPKKGCPTGFQRFQNLHSCSCSEAMNKFYNESKYNGYCNISDLTISLPKVPTIWIGRLWPNGETGITALCPLEFCLPCIHCSYVKLNNSTSTKYERINYPMDKKTVNNICRRHRTGVMCSDCDEGYSVVFGSGDCMKCSNWWLLTLLAYIVAGPLLIWLLYTLKLTLVTGTINGVIFCAQTANVGLLDVLRCFPVTNRSQIDKLLLVFLSLLNLNLGFPLCFYNGMNNFSKTILGFMFPVYLLLIVVTLIIASRYSTWLSNRTSHSSVQVLVTVVHLSFSQFITSSIDIFTYVRIITDSSDKYVWYRNGSIDFESTSDPQLAIAQVISVVVISIFVVPYLALLLGGRWILKTRLGNKYLRSSHEAIHGPFKESKKYWFTARILLLIIAIILYVTFRGSNVTIYGQTLIPLLACFVFFQVYLRPFKHKSIMVLDSIGMIIVLLLAVCSLYIVLPFHDHTQFQSHQALSYYSTSIAILGYTVFIMFIIIIIYHLYSILPFQVKDRMVAFIMKFKSRLSVSKLYRFNQYSSIEINTEAADDMDCTRPGSRSLLDEGLREPVLDFS